MTSLFDCLPRPTTRRPAACPVLLLLLLLLLQHTPTEVATRYSLTLLLLPHLFLSPSLSFYFSCCYLSLSLSLARSLPLLPFSDSFKIYDVDGSGSIKTDELSTMLTACLSEYAQTNPGFQMEPDEIAQLITKVKYIY